MAHIVHGSRGGGWHHRPGGVNLSSYRIVKLTKKPDGPNSPYQARVLLPDGSQKISSFFPNSWSTKKVEAVIRETYQREVLVKGLGKGRHRVPSGFGFDLEMRLVPDGAGGLIVDIAFPVLR